MTTRTNGQPALCGSTYGDSGVSCTRRAGHADTVPGIERHFHTSPTGDNDGSWVWAPSLTEALQQAIARRAAQS